MGVLESAISDYELLLKKDYKYELLDKKDVEVKFKKENFPHLLGLHKLVDIKDLKRLHDKKIKGSKIYKKVTDKEISNEMVLSSPYYNKIENRFKYFNKINEIIFTKVIYNFDRTKVHTSIKADLVLYTIKDNLYIHLFLVKSSKGNYFAPMTFIVEEDDKYIKEQIGYDVKQISIIENGKVIKKHTYIKEPILEPKEIEVVKEREYNDM